MSASASTAGVSLPANRRWFVLVRPAQLADQRGLELAATDIGATARGVTMQIRHGQPRGKLSLRRDPVSRRSRGRRARGPRLQLHGLQEEGSPASDRGGVALHAALRRRAHRHVRVRDAYGEAHVLCTCGMQPFYRPRSHPDSWDINARCLDTPLTHWRVKPFDGANWEDAVDSIR